MYFEEIGIDVDGTDWGQFSGEFEFDPSDGRMTIAIERIYYVGSERRMTTKVLTPKSTGVFGVIFQGLEASLRRVYADDISDQLRSAARDYATDLKIRSALETV